jgi:hypothetical protein
VDRKEEGLSESKPLRAHSSYVVHDYIDEGHRRHKSPPFYIYSLDRTLLYTPNRNSPLEYRYHRIDVYYIGHKTSHENPVNKLHDRMCCDNVSIVDYEEDKRPRGRHSN